MKNISSSDALSVIRELAAQGHSQDWIARQLNLRGVPTISARGRWSGKSVWRVCQREGVRLRWRLTANVINSGAAVGSCASSRVGVDPQAVAIEGTG